MDCPPKKWLLRREVVTVEMWPLVEFRLHLFKTKSLLFCQTTCLLSRISNVTNKQKMNSQNVRLPNYQKAQLQSVSIFSKFVHPLLLWYLLSYPHLPYMFWSVILVVVPTVWILISFVTQFLKFNLSVTFNRLSQGSCCIKTYRNLFHVFFVLTLLFYPT